MDVTGLRRLARKMSRERFDEATITNNHSHNGLVSRSISKSFFAMSCHDLLGRRLGKINVPLLCIAGRDDVMCRGISSKGSKRTVVRSYQGI